MSIMLFTFIRVLALLWVLPECNTGNDCIASNNLLLSPGLVSTHLYPIKVNGTNDTLEVQHMLNCFAGAMSEIHDFSGFKKKKDKAAQVEMVRKVILTKDCGSAIEVYD